MRTQVLLEAVVCGSRYEVYDVLRGDAIWFARQAQRKSTKRHQDILPGDLQGIETRVVSGVADGTSILGGSRMFCMKCIQCVLIGLRRGVAGADDPNCGSKVTCLQLG